MRKLDDDEMAQLEAECSRKVRYDSEKVARSIMLRRLAAGAEGLRVYLCRWCGGWHMTHMPSAEDGHGR